MNTTIILALICGLQLAASITALVCLLRYLTDRDKLQAKERADTLTAHRAEVATLLQRIQAPQVAVWQHEPDTPTPDPSQGMPLSDEQVAEIQDKELAQAMAEVDQLEAEHKMAVL